MWRGMAVVPGAGGWQASSPAIGCRARTIARGPPAGTDPRRRRFRMCNPATSNARSGAMADSSKASSDIHHLHFPGESASYRKARNALLKEEMALRRGIERVAARRRALPPGGAVPEDYRFEGESGPVMLSQLFDPGKDTL